MRLRQYLPLKVLHTRQIKFILLLFLGLLFSSCHREQFKWKNRKKNTLELIQEKDSTLKLEGISKSSNYGYSPDEPIRLGVTSEYLSASYPEKYLNSLTGPNGETVYFERIKSCCPFKTVNSSKESYQNVAVLEIYKVTYNGLKKPVYFYINFFDQGTVLAPHGFLPKPWIP